tara:strand:+ start:1459 stop:2106 length:648 start_codon:yes stop_codon:yes gene_type:complete
LNIKFSKSSAKENIKSKNQRDIIRQQVRQLRQDLTSKQQTDAALQLLARFSVDEKILSANSIALYLSNDGELDTEILIEWCWQQGKQVYLPVLHPFAKGHLLFLHYERRTPLVNNRFGIAEPKLDVSKVIVPHQLDIICTPLVAFDHLGARLGMGGGFYDRTLSRWHQHHQQQSTVKPYPIGLAHDCQLVAPLPSESWDIPLPEIITPSMHYKFN